MELFRITLETKRRRYTMVFRWGGDNPAVKVTHNNPMTGKGWKFTIG